MIRYEYALVKVMVKVDCIEKVKKNINISGIWLTMSTGTIENRTTEKGGPPC
jgi:hypothetical protein